MTASPYYERNMKTLKALANAGANLAKPHTIEHHVYCDSIADVELVKQRGLNLGYEIMHDESRNRDGMPVWSFDLAKKCTPTIENIESQALEIQQIIHGIRAKYDGWGTEVEK
jgi:regulator of RNase E activity RraB